MSAIVTKYVAEHKLSKDMRNEELSQHVPELLELLTDKLKRVKGCQRFQKGYHRSKSAKSGTYQAPISHQSGV